MQIEGEKVALRPAQPDDAPFLLRWALNPEVARPAHGDYPTTMEATLAWIEAARRDRYRQVYTILDARGQPIGDIDLHHISWRRGEAELRIRIGEPELWGCGLGTDAIRTLLRFVFTQGHLRRVYLRVLKDNRRAVRCYEKCGFRPEGRLALNGSEILLMSVQAGSKAVQAPLPQQSDHRRAWRGGRKAG